MPKPSPVTIKIYDILGREVKTLLDRRFEAGSHAAIWDGKNSRELPVASGVYFIWMLAGEFVRVKKLVLLRLERHLFRLFPRLLRSEVS